VVTFVSAALMLGLLLTVAINLAFGGIRFTGFRANLTRAARLQIGFLAGAYFVAQAIAFGSTSFQL